MAATAAVHKAASAGRHMFKLHKPRLAHSEPSSLDAADQERDREFVVKALDHHDAQPMAPEEVAQDPEKKALGRRSRALERDDFELIRTLGTGTFARVWLARLSNSNEELKDKVFALKVLRKADVIRLKQVEHVMNERAVLAAVAGHPFIVTLITTFSDHDSLYMLLDYCPGGEVFTYLRRVRRFDLHTARFYAAEIFLIFEFLHEVEHVAYRDLKPENLLLDSEGHIKLVDFGFAKKVAHGATYTLCGTPEYLAPEVIQSKVGHSIAVDWWAFGILIYEFLVGQPPFWDENPIKIYEKILHQPIRFPRDMSPDAEDLIKGLCTVDRSRRLGNLQGGPADIKRHAFFAPIDWTALYNRSSPGPMVPRLEHAADTSNFDDYPDEDASKRHPYTDEMRGRYEDVFRDF